MAAFDKKKYTIDYIKNNTRQFMIKVSRIYEQDMIDFLEAKENVNEYVKRLIREDMEKHQEA